MDQPHLLADVPLAEIEPLSAIHGAAHTWRALEPVELLQSAGRRGDAAVLARSIEGSQPPGEEGDPGRRLSRAIARGAELAQALTEGPPAAADLTARADAVTSAITDLEASFAEDVQDGLLRSTLDGLLTLATAPALLLAPTVPDPAAVAGELERAAGLLLGTPSAHASGAQRASIARAWQVAALLLRYDAAVGAVGSDAPALLQAAKRQSEVLRNGISASEEAPSPLALVPFSPQ